MLHEILMNSATINELTLIYLTFGNRTCTTDTFKKIITDEIKHQRLSTIKTVNIFYKSNSYDQKSNDPTYPSNPSNVPTRSFSRGVQDTFPIVVRYIIKLLILHSVLENPVDLCFDTQDCYDFAIKYLNAKGYGQTNCKLLKTDNSSSFN